MSSDSNGHNQERLQNMQSKWVFKKFTVIRFWAIMLKLSLFKIWLSHNLFGGAKNINYLPKLCITG